MCAIFLYIFGCVLWNSGCCILCIQFMTVRPQLFNCASRLIVLGGAFSRSLCAWSYLATSVNMAFDFHLPESLEVISFSLSQIIEMIDCNIYYLE